MSTARFVSKGFVYEAKEELSRADENTLVGLTRLADQEFSIARGLTERIRSSEDLRRNRAALFVGYAAFSEYMDDPELQGFATIARQADAITIDKLYVHPIARGRGIGSLLVDACIDYAAEYGARSVTYPALPGSSTTPRLLEHRQFIPAQDHFVKVLE